MQQFDMTVNLTHSLPTAHTGSKFHFARHQAWLKAGSREEIAILASETTPGLVEFQKKLVDRYRMSPSTTYLRRRPG